MGSTKAQRAKQCQFDGCDKPNFAYGYCSGHAAQVRKGKPLAPLRQPRPEPAEGFVWCSTCKQYREENDFGWDKTRDDFVRQCNPCRAEYMRSYNKKNAESIRLKVTLRKWGFTEEQYLSLFEIQNHRCAICGSERRDYRTLAVDHDHKTGAVRGLLCQDCNMALGQFKDDPEILDAAAAYLRSGGPLTTLALTVGEEL